MLSKNSLLSAILENYLHKNLEYIVVVIVAEAEDSDMDYEEVS